MKKFKIIFIANNIKQNCIINNILKNICFKNCKIDIFYLNQKKRYNFFINILLKIIFCVEKKFLLKNENIISKSNYKIKKNINEKIFLSILNSNLKLNKIDDNYITDVVINISDHPVSKKLIKISKNGVWEINTNNINIFFTGFWESFFNLKTITSQLVIKKINKNKIVKLYADQTILNNKINFWLRNKYFISIKSSNLIIKNLNKLFYNIKIKNLKNFRLVKFPNLSAFILLKYIFSKYLKNFIIKIYNKFSKLEKPLWNIFVKDLQSNLIIYDKNILYGSRNIHSLNNHEWADPFIFKYEEKEYVFFENNDLKLNRGKISCGILFKNELKNVKDILKFDHHLSYPFIWKKGKDIYLMPESSANKSLTIWKSIQFPYKWKIYKTLFKNELCCDSTILSDKKKNNWLFVNKSNDQTNDFTNELYVYKIIGDFKKIIPHNLNPVITNCEVARNAGFLKVKNHIIRVSQINNSTGYGLGLNINKITNLNLKTFDEKIIKKIIPSKKNKVYGLHHISNIGNKIIFDVKKI